MNSIVSFSKLVILTFIFSALGGVAVAQYCTSNATSSADSKIHNVSLVGNTQNINNLSPNVCEAYTNYTALASADITQGASYTVNITQGTCGGEYTRFANAWIDWNQDNDFNDPGEMLGLGTSSSATALLVTSINFTVPGTALTGNTRMRVIVKEGGAANDPCSVYTWGETEDYTVTVVAGVPMSYVSSTVSQASTSSVVQCSNDQVVIGMQVVTSGFSSPLNLTQFRLQTTGSTNPIADIQNVEVYSTGNNPVFATSTLFGSSAPSASGVNFNVNGSVNLLNGVNYFWVAYDLLPSSNVGDFIDGICNRIVISAINRTPSVTNPTGNRLITVCPPSPGGVNTSLQAWFNSNTGTVGSPVTQWNNLASNPNIPSLTSVLGGVLTSNDPRSNYNNTINTQGNVHIHNGTFHREVDDRTRLISGNEVTMYTVFHRSGVPDLSFEFHGSTVTNPSSNGSAQWLNWGFRHAGQGTHFSNGTMFLYDNPYRTSMAANNNNTNFSSLFGRSTGAGGNSLNGNETSIGNVGTFHPGGNFMELSIGYWPGYGSSNGYMESILWDKSLTNVERSKVDSYLAIKYGITLGVIGVSKNYYSPSDVSIIWNSTTNNGYNFDIAGIGRSDVSSLSQYKSHSTNGSALGLYSDILTIVNGGSFASPTAISVDNSFFIWGHNGLVTEHTGGVLSYVTDNAEIIQTIFQRKWKAQESGTINNLVLEFDLSNVPGVGGVIGMNDLANLRLLVDEEDNFTTGATSIAPSSFNNATGIAYFTVDFVPGTGNIMDQGRGFFFTLGSTNAVTTPLPIQLGRFDVSNQDCQNLIHWTTISEQYSDYYLIQRSTGDGSWLDVGKVDAAGNSDSELEYIVADNDFKENGVIYYRLIQYDTDGKANNLGEKSVECFCEDNIKPAIYPNPTSKELNINVNSDCFVKIVEMSGRLLYYGFHTKGWSSIDVNEYQNGVYFIEIDIEGKDKYVTKIVKQ